MSDRPTTVSPPRKRIRHPSFSARSALAEKEGCQLPDVSDSTRRVYVALYRNHSKPRVAYSGCVRPPQPRSVLLKSQLVDQEGEGAQVDQGDVPLALL